MLLENQAKRVVKTVKRRYFATSAHLGLKITHERLSEEVRHPKIGHNFSTLEIVPILGARFKIDTFGSRVDPRPGNAIQSPSP